MIEITNLTITDRGRWVRYIPSEQEIHGCILRWDGRFVYVVWSRNGQSRAFDSDHYEVTAVNPANLEFFDLQNDLADAPTQGAEEAMEIQFERIVENHRSRNSTAQRDAEWL
jgi:hypothetical protein